MASKKDDQSLLTTREAARYLRLSHRTLEGFRVRGTGPSFIKAGRGLRSRVLYHPADINIWLETRFSSTSEYEPWLFAVSGRLKNRVPSKDDVAPEDLGPDTTCIR